MKRIIIVLLFIMVSVGVFAESNIVNQISEKLINYVENAEDFLTEQTPEYIEQLLTFKAMKAKTFLIVWLVIDIFLLFGIFGLFIYAAIEEDGFLVFLGCVILLLAFLISIIILDYYFDLKQIELAPKVYILEYLKSLM